MNDPAMSDPATTPIVYAKDGTVFANSRDVAAYFRKRHDHVLRDIRALEIPPNLGASWFHELELPDAYGRMAATFDMTRDGFALLVMGYTGAKAMGFKIKYINRFNEMEAALKAQFGPTLPDFSNPAMAARAWADQYEQRLLADERTKRAEGVRAAGHQLEPTLERRTPTVAEAATQ